MNTNFKYLWYLLKHKWFVLVEGLKLGVPLWALIIHDWQKFTLAEYGPYRDYFYGEKGALDAFNKAWLHHIHYGPHHYQYWLLDGQPLDMPKRYRLEMLADLRATGIAKKGYDDTVEYYTNNQLMFKAKLHPDVRLWLETELGLVDTHVYLVCPATYRKLDIGTYKSDVMLRLDEIDELVEFMRQPYTILLTICDSDKVSMYHD